MAARIVKVEPFDLVVFGGTGDLAYRKLYSALMNREKSEQFSDSRYPGGAVVSPLC